MKAEPVQSKENSARKRENRDREDRDTKSVPDSWRIGNVTIPNRTVLAPMEAVNCAAFRVLCRRHGAGLVYTDMVDTRQFLAALKENRGDETATVRQVINPQQDERPLTIQLGSGEPDDLAMVVQIVTRHADLLDFNLGCPLSGMLGRKGGVYLMKHPEKLMKMLPDLLDNATVPVTAKIRSGWSDSERNAVQIAQLLEQQGIAAVAVHARTRKQRYMARADWEVIRQVKAAVSIPVIGNGDVSKPYHAVTLLGQTKADAVMIGRGARGNPTIFSQTVMLLATGRQPPEPTRQGRDAIWNEFLDLYEQREGRLRLSELQDHAGWFVAGLPNASALRRRARGARDVAALRRMLRN